MPRKDLQKGAVWALRGTMIRPASLLLLPFLLVAGMHYRRDIIGKAADSWQSRLQEAGLEVSAHDAGLAVLPGIEGLIARHIGDADSAFGS